MHELTLRALDAIVAYRADRDDWAALNLLRQDGHVGLVDWLLMEDVLRDPDARATYTRRINAWVHARSA